MDQELQPLARLPLRDLRGRPREDHPLTPRHDEERAIGSDAVEEEATVRVGLRALDEARTNQARLGQVQPGPLEVIGRDDGHLEPGDRLPRAVHGAAREARGGRDDDQLLTSLPGLQGQALQLVGLSPRRRDLEAELPRREARDLQAAVAPGGRGSRAELLDAASHRVVVGHHRDHGALDGGTALLQHDAPAPGRGLGQEHLDRLLGPWGEPDLGNHDEGRRLREEGERPHSRVQLEGHRLEDAVGERASLRGIAGSALRAPLPQSEHAAAHGKRRSWTPEDHAQGGAWLEQEDRLGAELREPGKALLGEALGACLQARAREHLEAEASLAVSDDPGDLVGRAEDAHLRAGDRHAKARVEHDALEDLGGRHPLGARERQARLARGHRCQVRQRLLGRREVRTSARRVRLAGGVERQGSGAAARILRRQDRPHHERDQEREAEGEPSARVHGEGARGTRAKGQPRRCPPRRVQTLRSTCPRG